MRESIYLDIKGNFGLGDYLCMDPLLTALQIENDHALQFFTTGSAGNLMYRSDVVDLSLKNAYSNYSFDRHIKIYGYKELGLDEYAQLEKMDSLIAHMGSYGKVDTANLRPKLYLQPIDFLKIPQGISKESNFVAVCTDFTDPRRHLPISTWLELINVLSELGMKIVLIGAQSLRDQVNIFQWRKIKNAIAYDLQQKLKVRETAALISRCKIFIGNNSGLFHYAQAADTDCLVTMSVNNPLRYIHPGGPKVEWVISSELPCIRCTEKSFQYMVLQGCVSSPVGLCMRTIKSSDLADKFIRLMGNDLKYRAVQQK